jgi:polar amino acid transport system substrate-binding protein
MPDQDPVRLMPPTRPTMTPTNRVLSAIAVVIWCLLPASAATETLRVRADTWMPFNGDPASAQPGYVVEALKAIFEPQGITIDYQNLPWADTLKAAENGEVDAAIGASRTEAAHLVLPEENITVARVGLFVRKGNPWAYTNKESFAKVRLGAIDGYNYWDVLDDYIKSHGAPQVTLFTGTTPLPDAISKLRGGEIEMMPETLPVFIWALREQHLSIAEFRIAYTHQGDDVFVAFAPTDAGRRYAKLFDAGLRQLRKSGELAKLLQKYGLEDWK